MANAQSPDPQQAQFAAYVADCRFFDDDGTLDLEKFCVHLRLCLFCDGAVPPDSTALYVLMLKCIGAARTSVDRGHVRKIPVTDWDDSLLPYYPDRQQTRVHFDALNVVYPGWIQQVGETLMEADNPGGRQGRYWVGAELVLTSTYLGRFESELVRVGGLARVIAPRDVRLS